MAFKFEHIFLQYEIILKYDSNFFEYDNYILSITGRCTFTTNLC